MQTFNVPTISSATDLDHLRISIGQAFAQLVGQLNQLDTQLDGNNQRVINVAIPTSPNDAVSKRYLEQVAAQYSNIGRNVGRSNGRGKDAYTMVFANGGTMTNSQIIPAFIVGSDREGTPEDTWVYVESTGTGNTVFNFSVDPGATGTFTNLLATNGTLTAGSAGPLFLHDWLHSYRFTKKTIVKPLIVTAGDAQNFTFGVVVRRA